MRIRFLLLALTGLLLTFWSVGRLGLVRCHRADGSVSLEPSLGDTCLPCAGSDHDDHDDAPEGKRCPRCQVDDCDDYALGSGFTLLPQNGSPAPSRTVTGLTWLLPPSPTAADGVGLPPPWSTLLARQTVAMLAVVLLI